MRSPVRRIYSDEEIRELWESAWDESPCTNPYSVKIDKALRAKGLSVNDIKVRVGVIRGKAARDRLDSEQELLDFSESLVFLAEQSMVDKCTESTQGAIFLLESKYGYRKGQDINITASQDTVKTVRRFGDVATESEAKPSESEAV